MTEANRAAADAATGMSQDPLVVRYNRKANAEKRKSLTEVAKWWVTDGERKGWPFYITSPSYLKEWEPDL